MGYQCSAAYRHIIIPRVCLLVLCLQLACVLTRRTAQGLLRDNHFLMTSGGEAVWAGSRNRKSDD